MCVKFASLPLLYNKCFLRLTTKLFFKIKTVAASHVLDLTKPHDPSSYFFFFGIHLKIVRMHWEHEQTLILNWSICQAEIPFISVVRPSSRQLGK